MVVISIFCIFAIEIKSKYKHGKNLWDQEYNDINMFKILHASADYFLCSFEFENLETREHIFADYFDDPLYELLTQFNLDHDVELVGKEIETIPSICSSGQKRGRRREANCLLQAHGSIPGLEK